ncbi:MAG: DEAD/DEAH box helicase [Alphaproteobacteria bacterium]|nr:DEAD/DEAH box helicase [Alphaproteobacteria bacterium]MBV9692776.1 DEAD/DEAH box helicase [Alphaproteobacteria bacterium]
MTNVTSAGAQAGVEVSLSETSGIPSPEGTELDNADAVPSPPSPSGFAALGLSAELLKAVEQSGYTIPTPIQAQGIPEVLKRRDVIGIAQTGTGKTASFTLPMIEMLARGRAKARMPRSLILEPTRELAAQVAESFEKYGKYNKLSMALLIGGTSFDDQDRKLDRGVDVLIATPGRLLDHFSRGKLMLSQVQILVVDEADRMLDMGFIPDVEEICKKLPFTRQTLFYSATMPPEIQRLTEKFLHNPVRVEVARPATTAANITQEAIEVPANDWAKREALRRLIRDNAVTNAIVFCNRKTDVDIVAKSLIKHGFNAAPLHGDLDQSVRTRTLDGFRAGRIGILVASDVAARGLDIPAVGHIFNFDVPYHPDDYVHRIGRTGRAGRSGHAFMLVTPRDGKYLEAIEKLIGKKLEARALEGLSEAVQARPREERRDRGRGRPPARNDRDRKRDYPIKPHGQVAAMEPVAPVAAPVPSAPVQSAPVQTAPVQAPLPTPPRPDHRHKHQHDHRQDHRARERKPQQPHEPAEDTRSQLPAFLLRPVKLPKAPEKLPPKPRNKAEADS